MKKGLVIFGFVFLLMMIGFVSAALPVLGTVEEGETITLTSKDGILYNVNIDFMSADKVKLNINEEPTEILEEGDVFGFDSEFFVEVIDINYVSDISEENNVMFLLFDDILKEDDTKRVVVDDENYDVIISYIDSDEVRLNINEEVTPKIREGEMHSLSDDIKIRIVDINRYAEIGIPGNVVFNIFNISSFFDDVNVLYAARVIMNPVLIDSSDLNNVWLTEIAGNTNNYLFEGETKSLVIGEENYEASIDYLDSNEVRLIINEELTSKIKEGDSYSLSNGAQIKILDVFYPSGTGEKGNVVLSLTNSVGINTSNLISPIEVLYGVVELVGEDYSFKQTFISFNSVGSKTSTERFLSKRLSTKTNLENPPFLDESVTSFLSSKKLEGTEIIRNYSESIESVKLFNDFNVASDDLEDISLSSHYFETLSDIPSDFYDYVSKPTENYWQADMNTLIQIGDINLINK